MHVIDEVILKANNASYKVLSHFFKIVQPQQNGHPFGRPHVESFKMTIESDGDDAGLMALAIHSTKTIDGSIDFMSAGALVSQITFSGAYVVEYENEGVYDLRSGKSSITEDVKLLPKTFRWNDAEYDQAA